jgi:TolB-like protein/Tfp pilus assembly protein PilF
MKPATESSEQHTNSNGSQEPPISAEMIRAQLEKILSSSGFATAERLSRFLRYTVEESLAGQTDKLKESFLGVEVFGRRPTYDPRMDAVVRTEAVKLRARLKDYYAGEGREDALFIDLPKGGYVPAFRWREKTPVTAAVVETLAAVASSRWRWTLAIAAAVAIIALGWFFAQQRWRTDARGPELSSIAVLPFTDLSPERNQEYFCDGMTDEIIDALAKVGGFRVVARTSSFAFKGKQQDIREIGRRLGVAAVLEGSVRKDGNRLRVTAQLNSVTDGYHLWSETYERELKDVFALQDEISRSIVDTLQVKLANGRTNWLVKPPEDLAAYDLYLQGRYHWGRWRTEGAEKSTHYFEQAIARDPKYAAAWAGLADSYAWLAFFGALPPNQAMPKAREAAHRALALDDSLAAAHTSLAYVKTLYEFDWTGAEREFRRAIELNPGFSEAHFGYGITWFAPKGRMDDAVREMQRARDLDPLSLPTNTYLGLALQMDGKVDDAIRQLKKTLELDPSFPEAHTILAGAYLDRGLSQDVHSELDALKGIEPGARADMLFANCFAVEGRRAEALDLAHKWEALRGKMYVRPTSIAQVYAQLGDNEKALTWLETAYAERDGMLAYLGTQHVYHRMRRDPRFIALIRKIGLPE